MTGTPGPRLVRAGVGLAFGVLVMQGTRPDADRYQRLSAVMLLAALAVDSSRHNRELAHHHRALKLLTGVVEDLTRRQDRAQLQEHQHW